jgi:hypothetical protein
MPDMLRTHNTLHLHFSSWQHARLCLFLAVVLFGLSLGSYYWNESIHYRLYLGMGLIFFIVGVVPFLMHLLQGKSK